MEKEFKPEDILTTSELAERWKVKESSLSQQRSNGKGPVFIKGPGIGVRYKFKDILIYEEENSSKLRPS